MIWRSLVALVFMLGLGACAQGPATVRDSAAAEANIAVMDAIEYRLGSGDELKVTVFDEERLSGEFLVNGAGRVAFPLVGEVEAAGKTLPEFAEALQKRLQEGFLREPRVAVEVTNYRPFFILGEVNDPGTYPFSANLTVLNAVATAGGFTYRADSRRVYIKHVGQPNERQYSLTGATPVQPGDTIRIGERRF